MTYLRATCLAILFLSSITSQAQTIELIGTSEDFILENVKGYPSVKERSLEHEEFNVLVFEDQGRELSFYFTFYRGGKVCSYIKSIAPVSAMKTEVDFIKANFTNIKDNVWENAAKTVQVQISESERQVIMWVKEIRN